MLVGGAAVSHGWRPETGFLPYTRTGYDEALLVYLLGLGSPTFPLPGESYSAYYSTYQWKTIYGRELLYSRPLFTHQLSHLWIDLRAAQPVRVRRLWRVLLGHHGDRRPGLGDASGERHRATVLRLSRTRSSLRSRRRNVGAVGGGRFAPEIVIPTIRAMARLEKKLGFRERHDADAEKLPVLFVHGIGGTPRDFARIDLTSLRGACGRGVWRAALHAQLPRVSAAFVAGMPDAQHAGNGVRGGSAMKGDAMKRKMRAAVLHEFGGRLRIDEVGVPEVRPGRILVEIQASGVCHTDLHAGSPRYSGHAVAPTACRSPRSLVGLPPGAFPIGIFDTVLNWKTIRGSIVGTRLDLTEALAFAGEGKVRCHYSTDALEHINAVFDRMRAGTIEGRVVLTV